MATYLKIFLLTFLLSSMILLEEVKTVMAKRGKLKQRVKMLEKSVSELKEEMKDQKEKMEELEKCSGCAKIKEIFDKLSELQDKIDSEETWQKMNTDPVCFGTRDNQPGAFRILKGGRVKTIKLIYKSGAVTCNADLKTTHWGCTHDAYGNNGLLTVITNANKETVMPPSEYLKERGAESCNKKDYYNLDGTTNSSPELVFPDLAIPLSVSRDQELQIWYTQDLNDCTEGNNSGKTCADVYAWYA